MMAATKGGTGFKLCANISWLFRELPFLERPEAARRAGFMGIEFHTLEGTEPGQVARAARESGVRIVLFNAWPGDFFEGGAGLSGVPGREAAFRDEILNACELGAHLGGALVQIGQSRVLEGVDRDECRRVFIENLRYAGPALEAAGCKALVEPMNATDAPGVLIRSAREAVQILQQAAVPAASLQLDCYHEYMAGANICKSIAAFARHISHVQVSDAPGRQEPGSGRIDYASVWRALGNIQYDRWLSAEYRSSRPTLATLDWVGAIQGSPPGKENSE